MILDAARLSLANLFAPATRSVFWKVLGLTLLALAALWFGLREVFIWLALPWLDALMPGTPAWAGWLTFVLGIFASLGLALALALLLAPVTALIAGSAKFLGVVILGNILALFLLLVPGVNLIAFFLVNGYLLGREFFEFAAMRYRSPAEARLFRAKHRSTVFLAGLLLAAFLAVPLLNLLTPLFAAGMMVHLHKKLSASDPGFSLPRSSAARV